MGRRMAGRRWQEQVHGLMAGMEEGETQQMRAGSLRGGSGKVMQYACKRTLYICILDQYESYNEMRIYRH